jgi:hypothetical protein
MADGAISGVGASLTSDELPERCTEPPRPRRHSVDRFDGLARAADDDEFYVKVSHMRAIR